MSSCSEPNTDDQQPKHRVCYNIDMRTGTPVNKVQMSLIEAKIDSEDDAKYVMELRNQPSVMARTRIWPDFMEEYRRYFKNGSANPMFGVVDGVKVGFVRLDPCGDEMPGAHYIAYIVDESHRGYGTELVRSSTRYFHDVLHKNDIIAEIKDDNPPSLKLMKHCGYKEIELYDHLIKETGVIVKVHKFKYSPK